jgi:hypothetical protein
MTLSLPSHFNEEGLLPQGDYVATFDDLRRSLLVRGPEPLRPTWDLSWRQKLVTNLETLVRQLWQCGIHSIVIDGSFVEDKDHPNDIDGYFECDFEEFATGELQRRLNLLDPQKVWTWSESSWMMVPGLTKPVLPMWLFYRVELFPHYGLANTGIRDERGAILSFPEAFRKSRSGDQPKGVVQIRKEAV